MTLQFFINNFKMSNKKVQIDQQQTNIHSPIKTRVTCFDKPLETPPQLLTSYNIKDQPKSITQTHLYSRSIVRKLMQSTKANTIRHQINQIDKSSVLYAKPNRYDRSQFQFSQIPAKNRNYSSSCSSKIKQINEKIKKNTLPSQRSKINKSQIGTTTTETPKNSQQVTISGLITYKFNSVNAQRSLGFNQINHEQKMQDQIKETNKIRACPNNRFKKILYNTNHKKYKESIRQERSILSNFVQNNDQYLTEKIQENEEQKLIYGEKAKNLHFIKEYMHTENASYEIGRHIIDEIQKTKPKEVIVKQHRSCKTEVDEDIQFERRRVPSQKKRVQIRFLTFVD